MRSHIHFALFEIVSLVRVTYLTIIIRHGIFTFKFQFQYSSHIWAHDLKGYTYNTSRTHAAVLFYNTLVTRAPEILTNMSKVLRVIVEIVIWWRRRDVWWFSWDRYVGGVQESDLHLHPEDGIQVGAGLLADRFLVQEYVDAICPHVKLQSMRKWR